MTRSIHSRLAFVVLAAALGTLALAAGGSAQRAEAAPTASRNIVQTAVAAGQFKTLVALVKKAGLAGSLSGSGKLTVFAPTDAAFKRVPKATLDKLAQDRQLLRSVLLYHVVKGNVKAAQVVKLRSAATLNGKRVRIAVRNGGVYLNGNSRVVKADVGASNGTIHVVSRVLIPPAG
jgi:uncharacterized surface protein with fasciclin (FAS1) repeats